jgi:hypothetical protein
MSKTEDLYAGAWREMAIYAKNAASAIDGLSASFREVMDAPYTIRMNRKNRSGKIVTLNQKTAWMRLDHDGHIIKRKYRDIL